MSNAKKHFTNKNCDRKIENQNLVLFIFELIHTLYLSCRNTNFSLRKCRCTIVLEVHMFF